MFAGTLKKVMKERGLTVKAISVATGIPQSTISEWTGGREPKLGDAVVRLARFLGLSVEYLATGEESEKKMVADILKN